MGLILDRYQASRLRRKNRGIDKTIVVINKMTAPKGGINHLVPEFRKGRQGLMLEGTFMQRGLLAHKDCVKRHHRRRHRVRDQTGNQKKSDEAKKKFGHRISKIEDRRGISFKEDSWTIFDIRSSK